MKEGNNEEGKEAQRVDLNVASGGEGPNTAGGRGGRRDRGSGVYLRSQRLNAPLPISERQTRKLDIVL